MKSNRSRRQKDRSKAVFSVSARSVFTFLFISIALYTIGSIACAQDQAEKIEPFLRAVVDRDSAMIGDIVRIDLEYLLPPGTRLPEKQQIEGLEKLTLVQSSTEAGRIRMQFLMDRLNSWQTGPLRLAYLDPGGEVKFLETEPVHVKIVSNLGQKPEEAELLPIRDILPSQPRWLSYLPWIIGLGAVSLVAVILFRMFKKRRAGTGSISILEPPDVTARREIRRIDSEGLFERGEIKPFYFSYSEILRRYLEAIRHFPAAEFTTEEIARHIGGRPEDQNILPLLKQADRVKFADTVPTAGRKAEDIKAALAYIDETCPKKDGDSHESLREDR